MAQKPFSMEAYARQMQKAALHLNEVRLGLVKEKPKAKSAQHLNPQESPLWKPQ